MCLKQCYIKTGDVMLHWLLKGRFWKPFAFQVIKKRKNNPKPNHPLLLHFSQPIIPPCTVAQLALYSLSLTRGASCLQLQTSAWFISMLRKTEQDWGSICVFIQSVSSTYGPSVIYLILAKVGRLWCRGGESRSTWEGLRFISGQRPSYMMDHSLYKWCY